MLKRYTASWVRDAKHIYTCSSIYMHDSIFVAPLLPSQIARTNIMPYKHTVSKHYHLTVAVLRPEPEHVLVSKVACSIYEKQCTVNKSGNHRYTNSCSLYSAENLSVWGNDVAFNQCPWCDDCMKTPVNVTKAGIMLHHMYGHRISIEAVNICFWFRLAQ